MRSFWMSTVVALAIACSVAGPGPAGGWTLPLDVESAGAAVVPYDDAPAWDSGAHCVGAFTPGAEELAGYLRQEFSQISRVFGYECRPNTAKPKETSQHGTGRAIDLAIATQGGVADNDLGDPVANWLVSNSTRIGVQLIIWDRTVWVGYLASEKGKRYTGPDLHIDHIHVELTHAAARRETPFFRKREGATQAVGSSASVSAGREPPPIAR